MLSIFSADYDHIISLILESWGKGKHYITFFRYASGFLLLGTTTSTQTELGIITFWKFFRCDVTTVTKFTTSSEC